MLQKTLSLYVHIPFCARKCNYCDFLSFNAEKELMDEYFDALKKEILKSAKDYRDRAVSTIFFGGGTPSFADEKRVCGLLQKIRDEFNVSTDAEISIEVNPASAMRDKLFSYREAGFNRLSIGCQSLNDDELKVLGRLHNSSLFYETYQNARAAGFNNINVDVMSALPGQSLGSYVDTLNKVLELRPEHISAYSLIIEEGTPFYDMDLDIPDEDTDRAMYHETKRILKEHGFHRYEISNYALGAEDDDTYECRHNKVYWQRGDYLGLGLGAASMVDNVRWSNTRDIGTYVKEPADAESSFDKIRENVEELNTKAQMEEFMFLGLRLVQGVSTEQFKENFGKDIAEVYGEVIDKYQKMGLLEYAGEGGKYLRLTDKGLDVSNTVMAEFLL
ncbi:radical SAM family heme chaperone HemW [Butyrivibrio sp. VCB2001]|uniref:radical SAM family heme chaperone HemW n=1 Tax=Butyrivibrio sp. VCB2001 TaxID=1280667 RepID=UPI0003F99363|nr:radical SAM family heme chaperone HemW [Butyrivibrio sp. VCB2001]